MKSRCQLHLNYIMATSRYLVDNVVDALFDDDFGLLDEDNVKIMKMIVFMVIWTVHFYGRQTR